MRLAELEAVTLEQDLDGPTHIKITVVQYEPGMFQVDVTTANALFDDAKALTSAYTWRLSDKPGETVSTLIFRFQTATFGMAAERMRELFGSHFTLAAPLYCYKNSVVVADLVPGSHTFVWIGSCSNPAQAVTTINSMATNEELPLVGKAIVDDNANIQLRLSTSANYLATYAKLAAICG